MCFVICQKYGLYRPKMVGSSDHMLKRIDLNYSYVFFFLLFTFPNFSYWSLYIDVTIWILHSSSFCQKRDFGWNWSHNWEIKTDIQCSNSLEHLLSTRLVSFLSMNVFSGLHLHVWFIHCWQLQMQVWFTWFIAIFGSCKLNTHRSSGNDKGCSR